MGCGSGEVMVYLQQYTMVWGGRVLRCGTVATACGAKILMAVKKIDKGKNI